MTEVKTYCWRRLDFVGLEIMQLTPDGHVLGAHASIIDAGPGQFSLRIEWMLEPTWRARTLKLTQQSRRGGKTLKIERGRRGWVVDDEPRPFTMVTAGALQSSRWRTGRKNGAPSPVAVIRAEGPLATSRRLQSQPLEKRARPRQLLGKGWRADGRRCGALEMDGIGAP